MVCRGPADHYRSLGKQALPLRDGSEARDLLTRVFESCCLLSATTVVACA